MEKKESLREPISDIDMLMEEFRALHGKPVDGVEKDADGNAKYKAYFKAVHDLANNGTPRTALCLSGGGIRSASYCLGVMQALAKHGLLHQFDYLSTVSGGGYIGGWLSALIHRSADPSPPDSPASDNIGRSGSGKAREAVRHVCSLLTHNHFARAVDGLREMRDKCTHLPNPEPLPIQHLRQYTRYLSPHSGFFRSDTWTLIATYLRNLAALWMVWIPLLLALVAIPHLVYIFHTTAKPEVRRFARQLLGSNANIWGGLSLDLIAFIAVLIAIMVIVVRLPSVQNGHAARSATLSPPPSPDSGDSFDVAQRYRRMVRTHVILPVMLASLLQSLRWYVFPWHDSKPGASVLVLLVPAIVFALVTANNLRLISPHRRAMRCIAVIVPSTVLAIGLYMFHAFVSPHIFHRASSPIWVVSYPYSYGLVNYGLGSFLQLISHVYRDYYMLYVMLATPLHMLVFLAFLSLYVAFTSGLPGGDNDREWLGRLMGMLMMAAVAWIGLHALSFFGPDLLKLLKGKIATPAALLGWIVSVAIPLISSRTNLSRGDLTAVTGWVRLITYIPGGLAVIAIASIFVVFSFAVEWLVEPLLPVGAWSEFFPILLLVAGLLVLAALLGTVMNFNRLSLHAMYRDRITRAYLGASNVQRRADPFTAFDDGDDMALCELRHFQKDNIRYELENPDAMYEQTVHEARRARSKEVVKPMLFINATLNMLDGANLAWQQRKARPFIFTPLHSGFYEAYRDTRQYGRAVSLGTAMTISGAAASPTMGYHSSAPVALLLALLNVRLGWWLGNPRYKAMRHDRMLVDNRWMVFDAPPYCRSGPLQTLVPLVSEALGATSDRSKYIYLSDGGHFDNLGLFEMVRRRCKLIVVCDASWDPEYTFDEVCNAIYKIRMDLGITVEFTDLAFGTHDGKAEAPAMPDSYAIARIYYNGVDEGDRSQDGYLLYLKPSLHEDSQLTVHNRSAAGRCFPHEPTVNQWFSESQFESYRHLGSATTDKVLCSLLPDSAVARVERGELIVEQAQPEPLAELYRRIKLLRNPAQPPEYEI